MRLQAIVCLQEQQFEKLLLQFPKTAVILALSQMDCCRGNKKQPLLFVSHTLNTLNGYCLICGSASIIYIKSGDGLRETLGTHIVLSELIDGHLCLHEVVVEGDDFPPEGSLFLFMVVRLQYKKVR